MRKDESENLDGERERETMHEGTGGWLNEPASGPAVGLCPQLPLHLSYNITPSKKETKHTDTHQREGG